MWVIWHDLADYEAAQQEEERDTFNLRSPFIWVQPVWKYFLTVSILSVKTIMIHMYEFKQQMQFHSIFITVSQITVVLFTCPRARKDGKTSSTDV